VEFDIIQYRITFILYSIGHSFLIISKMGNKLRQTNKKVMSSSTGQNVSSNATFNTCLWKKTPNIVL